MIAYDRRGHGRSSQSWDGNDMDTYSDDLHELFEKLDIHDVMMVGHSTGGGGVARFLGRHGTSRVSKAVLVDAVTPGLIKSDSSPHSVPLEVFDSFREQMIKDRSKLFIDVPSGPFFGFNRPKAEVSQGKIWSWWQQGMTSGFKNAYDCIKAFSETDTSEDLKRADIPILILHGTDDQVVPIDASARRAIKFCKQGTLQEIEGGPHALPTINVDEVNSALLKFLKS